MARLIISLVFLLLASKVLSQEFPSFDTLTLGNGLKVYLMKYGKEKELSVKLLIDAGRKNETSCEVGYSEIISELLAGAIAEKKGLLLKKTKPSICKMLNGQTVILNTCSSEDLSKEMAALSSALTRLMFSTGKMKPIVSAIGEGYMPENLSLDNLSTLFKDLVLYGKESALGRNYCQYQIQKVVPERLREFYLSHYIPKASTLIICGNFNVKEVRRIVAKNFVTWKALRKSEGSGEAMQELLPEITGKKICFVNKTESKGYLLKWLQSAPAFSSPSYPAFVVTCELFDRFAKEKLKGVNTDSAKFEHISYLNGIAEVRCFTNSNELFKITKNFDSTLKMFHATDFSELDLQEAKLKLKNDLFIIRSTEDVMLFYDPGTYDLTARVNYLSSLSGVTASDVELILKNYFTPGAYKLIIVGKEHVVSSDLSLMGNLTKYETSDFETCDEACKEVVIVKCHCESCYRRGYCNVWRFDPDAMNSIKSAKSRAKFTVK